MGGRHVRGGDLEQRIQGETAVGADTGHNDPPQAVPKTVPNRVPGWVSTNSVRHWAKAVGWWRTMMRCADCPFYNAATPAPGTYAAVDLVTLLNPSDCRTVTVGQKSSTR